MNQRLAEDDEKRIDEGQYHPVVNPFDVVGLRQRVEGCNEQWGQGHKHCCIDGDDGLKHLPSNVVVSQLVDQR